MKASYRKYAAIRDSLGLNDLAVSRESGVATATLSNWKATVDERQGGYRPKVENLSKLAKALGCEVLDLMEED